MAGLLTLAFTVLLWGWLASYKLRSAIAGSLLVVLIAVSAGTTLGVDEPYLKVSLPAGMAETRDDFGRLRLEIRPGMTVTFTIDFVGDPLDHPNVNCGDYLLVHIFSGEWLDYLEFSTINHGWYTDGNNDGDCDDPEDGQWDDFFGTTVEVTVDEDAIGDVSLGISYEVERQFWRVIAPRTIVRISLKGVEPPDPTPTPTLTSTPPPTPVPGSGDPGNGDTSGNGANSDGTTPGGTTPGGTTSGGTTPGGTTPGGTTSGGTTPGTDTRAPGGSGAGPGVGSDSPDSCPAPATPTQAAYIGSTDAAIANEFFPSNLWVFRKDVRNADLEFSIGWLSEDGRTYLVAGIIRDPEGQTYIIIRHENDDCIVRRWVPPYHSLVQSIPWEYIIAEFTVPKNVLGALPLDPLKPVHNQLIHRFDGEEERIYAFDATLQQWRHVPDIASFQALGFYWCDVTAASASYYARLSIGPPLPTTTNPARDDYPTCHTFLGS